MRKYTWLFGILILALLVAGCGKKQEAQSLTAPPIPMPGQSTTKAGEGANALGDLMKKSAGLTSYVATMDAGEMKSKFAVKMAEGKPVAMKIDTGPGGWTIMRMDKKMMYIYDPGTKSVMAMPVSASQAGAQAGPASSMPDAKAIEALKGMKTSADIIDGVECMKVSNEDGTKAYWIEKEHGLPVQATDAGKTIKFKYDQINSVPDSTFEVPAGVKTMAMPKMPNMPPMPKMPK